MIPLLGLSIYSVAIVLERSLFWLKISRGQNNVIKQLLNQYREDSQAASIMLKRHLDLPIARIFFGCSIIRAIDTRKNSSWL